MRPRPSFPGDLSARPLVWFGIITLARTKTRAFPHRKYAAHSGLPPSIFPISHHSPLLCSACSVETFKSLCYSSRFRMHLPCSISQATYGQLCMQSFRLKDVVYRRLLSIWSFGIVIVIKNFFVAFCCAVAQILLLDVLNRGAFGRWGPVSAIRHTCIRINDSTSYGGPYFVLRVHVGIFVVFSF